MVCPKTNHRPLHLPRRHIGVNAAQFPPIVSFSGSNRLLPSSSLELFQRTAPLPNSRFASTPRSFPTCADQILSLDRYHLSETFRSRRFSRPQRFAPQKAVQVCCTLLPVMGFARFLSQLFVLRRWSNDHSSGASTQTEICMYDHPPVILTRNPKTAANSHRTPKSNQMLFPTSASTLRSLPLRLGCASVTIATVCCHTIECHRLVYPSRCYSMRPSAVFIRSRCRFRFPPASGSSRSTSGT